MLVAGITAPPRSVRSQAFPYLRKTSQASPLDARAILIYRETVTPPCGRRWCWRSAVDELTAD
jgi:hypothetical protein